jgi:hypothetical protein
MNNLKYKVKSKILEFINLKIRKKIWYYHSKNMFKYIKKNNFKRITEGNVESVNISHNTINEFNIIKSSNFFKNKNMKKNIDEILQKLIDNKNIYIPGRNIKLEDLVVIDVITHKGSYYPFFHTDLEWNIFPNTNGFQIWFFKKNINPNVGNMYLYISKEQDYSLTPSWLKLSKLNNTIKVYNNFINDRFKMKKIKTMKKFNIKNGKFLYLNMKNNDCLIMSKNVWHSSCPYLKNNDDRFSINFRVIVRNSDRTINYNGNILYRKKNHIYKNNKLYNVGRFDLI